MSGSDGNTPTEGQTTDKIDLPKDVGKGGRESLLGASGGGDDDAVKTGVQGEETANVEKTKGTETLKACEE